MLCPFTLSDLLFCRFCFFHRTLGSGLQFLDDLFCFFHCKFSSLAGIRLNRLDSLGGFFSTDSPAPIVALLACSVLSEQPHVPKSNKASILNIKISCLIAPPFLKVFVPLLPKQQPPFTSFTAGKHYHN
jgi:hypothetical protein